METINLFRLISKLPENTTNLDMFNKIQPHSHSLPPPKKVYEVNHDRKELKRANFQKTF